MVKKQLFYEILKKIDDYDGEDDIDDMKLKVRHLSQFGEAEKKVNFHFLNFIIFMDIIA